MSRHTDRLFRGLFAGRSPASPPDESRPVRALGYAGYYEAHPEKPEEPRRGDFTEEADYTESINTFRSASEEYEQECADIQRRVEAGELIRYAVIGDRGIEFYYDEPIPVTEEQNESNSARQTRSGRFGGILWKHVHDGSRHRIVCRQKRRSGNRRNTLIARERDVRGNDRPGQDIGGDRTRRENKCLKRAARQ